MLWYLLIGYVVLSELVVLGLLLIGMLARDCPHDEEFERRMEQFEAVGPVRKSLAMIVTVAGAILLAPISAPLLLFALYRCIRGHFQETRYWGEIRATHHDLVLDEVHLDNITQELAENIEQNSPILESLGYQPLGTWWLKHEPFNSQARFLLQPGGFSIAEIGRTLDTCYCEVASWLEDGSMVSTVNCDEFDAEKFAEHGYHIKFCPGQEMTEVLAAHESFLQEIANRVAVPVRCLTPDDWREYVRYQNRRFSQIKFELGEAHEPVDCPFPEPQESRPAALPAKPATPDTLSPLVQDS